MFRSYSEFSVAVDRNAFDSLQRPTNAALTSKYGGAKSVETIRGTTELTPIKITQSAGAATRHNTDGAPSSQQSLTEFFGATYTQTYKRKRDDTNPRAPPQSQPPTSKTLKPSATPIQRSSSTPLEKTLRLNTSYQPNVRSASPSPMPPLPIKPAFKADTTSLRQQRTRRLQAKSYSQLLMDTLLGEDSAALAQLIAPLNVHIVSTAQAADQLSNPRSLHLILLGRDAAARRRTRSQRVDGLLADTSMGLLVAAKNLLDLGADPNYADSDGNTPLRIAVQYAKSKALISMLLTAGADVNQQTIVIENLSDDEDESSPHQLTRLEIAAQSATSDVERGSLIDMCIRLGQHQLIAPLMKAGARPTDLNITPLIVMANAYDGANNGLKAFCRTTLNAALFDAVDADDHVVAAALVYHGADVNNTDGSGRTSLYRAVERRGSALLIEVLLKGGSNPNVRDDADTPLAAFIIMRNGGNVLQIMKLLLNFGLDLQQNAGINITETFNENIQTNSDEQLSSNEMTLYDLCTHMCINPRMLHIIRTHSKSMTT